MKKLTTLLGAIYALSATAQSVDPVTINETNFPDANFRQYVSETYDTDSDKGVLSPAEQMAVKDCNIYNKGIKELTGIEYFVNLTKLYCADNHLTSLILERNTKLETLSCAGNQLTSLSLEKNNELTSLSCFNNSLTSLNVENNSKLAELRCYSNNLTSLNLKNNTELTFLSCNYNQLTELNLEKNSKLTNLYCSHNLLSTLNLEKNTVLTDLYCNDNLLTAIGIDMCAALSTLHCFNNPLTSLDVEKNVSLKVLRCHNCQLTSLNVENNTMLTDLQCYGNQLNLGTVDATGFTIAGLDLGKVSNVTGGSVSGGVFVPNNGTSIITYDYDTKNSLGEVMTVTLNFTNNTTTGINTINADRTKTKKCLENGRVVIERNGTKFDISGRKL